MSSRNADPDYYKVLGLTRSAKADEIKKAYRRLAVATHPDKNPQDPAAKANFQKVQHAHHILSNEASRMTYNALNPAAGLSTPKLDAQTRTTPETEGKESSGSESTDVWVDDSGEDSDVNYGSEGDEYPHEEVPETSGPSGPYYGAQWDNPSDEEYDSDDDSGSAGDWDPAWDEADRL